MMPKQFLIAILSFYRVLLLKQKQASIENWYQPIPNYFISKYYAKAVIFHILSHATTLEEESFVFYYVFVFIIKINFGDN